MADLSITVRNFKGSPGEIGTFLGVYTLSGERGQPYRGRPHTIVKKSFLQNEKVGIPVSELNDSIAALIEAWGGSERIVAATNEFKIETIHFEIYFYCNEMTDLSGYYLESRNIDVMSSIRSSFGVSWKLDQFYGE